MSELENLKEAFAHILKEKESLLQLVGKKNLEIESLKFELKNEREKNRAAE